MRISLVVPRFLPHLGGIENHVAALADHLSRTGCAVTVGTQYESTTDAPSTEITPQGFRIRRFRSGLPLLGHGLSPALWNWVRRGADDADVIHVHNAHAVTSMVAAGLARRPLVFTPHYLGRGESRASRLLHAAYDAPLRRSLHRVRAVICTTPSETAAFASDVGYGERCTTIPNGVEPDRHPGRPADVPDGPLIVMAGRLEAYKQPHLLLAAMTRLPAHALAFVGAGPAEPSLHRSAAELGVADRVRFPGRVPPEQMHAWYRAADVVASLSRRECFGMTLAEGLSAGANVVASDIGPHRDVLDLVTDAPAALVPVDATPDEVATAIRSLGRRPAGPPPAFPSWAEVAGAVSDVYQAVTGAAQPLGDGPGHAIGGGRKPGAAQ